MVVNIQFYFSIRRSAGSRRRALKHFFELRKEVKAFLKERDNDHAKEMESNAFIQILAYLSDILSHMNNLSVSMQG